MFTLAQVGLAALLVGQLGIAYYAIAQIAAVFHGGVGQLIFRLVE